MSRYQRRLILLPLALLVGAGAVVGAVFAGLTVMVSGDLDSMLEHQ